MRSDLVFYFLSLVVDVTLSVLCCICCIAKVHKGSYMGQCFL